ncbi:E3 UBIQUITIN-PROTEIN LIGASE SINA-LIKE 4 [Salix viminalis]|uniref:E3 UBIQUITIN-PROTEIN LIGASE SINA-LIKE 4 n=1 Tax=Salix viminalis TaxID=40686 RepID=A0A9Q0PA24_SALVM|nr:E3 UBIQUITIN-PROTEIN LIGASE SINA-LIKE 4 [Salix viminalis]
MVFFFCSARDIESIGNIVIVTCIRPSFSKDRFLYDLVASRGVSSLRLKSLTEPFPGRVEGLPPVDFLLIPFPFLGPSGQLDLEVCIWSSAELADFVKKMMLVMDYELDCAFQSTNHPGLL